MKTITSQSLQVTANAFARRNGHGRATKITLSSTAVRPAIGQTTRYGYRKYTTGEYVPNAYRNNYGWKNTYYQAACCEVIMPVALIFCDGGEWMVREPNGHMEPEGNIEDCITHCERAGWAYSIAG